MMAINCGHQLGVFEVISLKTLVHFSEELGFQNQLMLSPAQRMKLQLQICISETFGLNKRK
jgi:hypothetical protein